jgi:acyl-CoA dehydrogenase
MTAGKPVARATPDGKGFRYILDGMNAERILVAQECIGGRREVRAGFGTTPRERVVFDPPLGQNHEVQLPLASAWAELEVADVICRRAAALFDDGRECGADANIAKLLVSEATWRAAPDVGVAAGPTEIGANGDVARRPDGIAGPDRC